MKETSVRPLGWRAWKDKHGRWAWLLWFEWASEWIVHWSQRWDFVKVLGLAGKFALLIAAVSWIWEYGAREQARLDILKTKHYRAWELINSARGSKGDGDGKLLKTSTRTVFHYQPFPWRMRSCSWCRYPLLKCPRPT
jgi:hypothetical protein